MTTIHASAPPALAELIEPHIDASLAVLDKIASDASQPPKLRARAAGLHAYHAHRLGRWGCTDCHRHVE